MKAATPWRWCAAAGVVAFLCSWGFGRIPGLIACGPTNGLGPIIAFEFVRSPADVLALFGSEPCRSTLVGAQKIGLLLDGLGFIPAYTAFLACAALGCSPTKAGAQEGAARNWAPAFAGERLWAVVVIVGLIIAGLCDEIEGGLLYAILRDLPGTQPTIDTLWWAVHAKFALLGLGTLGIGGLIVMMKRPLAMLGGVIVGVGALKALYGLIVDLPGMMGGFTIAWVTILLAAFVASVRPSLFSGRDAQPPAPATPIP
jgi:hypothetical protein